MLEMSNALWIEFCACAYYDHFVFITAKTIFIALQSTEQSSLKDIKA